MISWFRPRTVKVVVTHKIDPKSLAALVAAINPPPPPPPPPREVPEFQRAFDAWLRTIPDENRRGHYKGAFEILIGKRPVAHIPTQALREALRDAGAPLPDGV